MAVTKTKDDKRITDLQVRNLKGKLSEILLKKSVSERAAFW